MNYQILPVHFDRAAILDDWEDPLKPLVNRFWSNITVDFDTDYIIRVRGKRSLHCVAYINLFFIRWLRWTRAPAGASTRERPLYSQSPSFTGH